MRQFILNNRGQQHCLKMGGTTILDESCLYWIGSLKSNVEIVQARTSIEFIIIFTVSEGFTLDLSHDTNSVEIYTFITWKLMDLIQFSVIILHHSYWIYLSVWNIHDRSWKLVYKHNLYQIFLLAKSFLFLE